MGFLTGFFGGFTLTVSALYITLHLHHANRQHQHLLLREQIDAINAIALPLIPINSVNNANAVASVMAQSGYYPRQQRPTVTELAKERWNAEVEGFVRRAQQVTWEDVWSRADEGWKMMERLVKRS
ncbi:hypothetical protein AJ80_04242 [Polytolypa hystricis UAMH7299]|uniref:MICOS complex subunit MIC12 n=1 Tax=Polytolypa hystricis (strain UAMH7299) TaxID=1447883 RepID=A0A2B7YE57_POLH7|nr:hypothetical protein AJ80_04242 [Polytolypa hystricis UAMH7299]